MTERVKGHMFSAAYQGRVREIAQMVLGASALWAALPRASRSVSAHPWFIGRVGGKHQIGQRSLGVRPDFTNWFQERSFTPLNLFHQL